MRVIAQANELAPGGRNVCVALGMFDGVHLGHQRVLNATLRQARAQDALSVAITFDRHPNAIVAPARTPPLIYGLAQRLRVMESLGLDAVLVIRFDHAFSQQSGETFITSLVHGFGRLQSVCIGNNFNFGHQRSGNVNLLRALGTTFDFAVEALPPVLHLGLIVSSTRIRGAVQHGDLEAAGQLLGRPYSLAGEVVHGEELGRKLGFPTANLNVAGLVVPPPSVYAGRATVAGRTWPAVMNVGYRPTLDRPVPELRAEVHLLAFEGDLYGRNLEFEVTRKLRGEQKFASLDTLRAQIARDVAAAEAALK